jgi:U3 small nucleolar RNA-associated protein 13
VRWRDVTRQQEEGRVRALEEDILVEQQMQNDLRHKRYGKALTAAMALGHSKRVMGILMAILEDTEGDSDNMEDATTTTSVTLLHKRGSQEDSQIQHTPIAEKLDEHVAAFTDDEIEKVVSYAQDWITNSRYCFVSSVLLHALIRVCGHARLSAIRSVVETLPGLISYSERHLQRIDRLNQGVCLAEYLRSLMSFLPMELSSGTHLQLASSAPNGFMQNAMGSMMNTNDVLDSNQSAKQSKKTLPVIFAEVEDADSDAEADDHDHKRSAPATKKAKKRLKI